MIIVGIDNATNKCGLAIIDTEKKEAYITTIQRKTKSYKVGKTRDGKTKRSSKFLIHKHPYEVLDGLMEYLDAHKITKDNIDLVMLETYRPGRYTNNKGVMANLGNQWVPVWFQGFLSHAMYDKYKTDIEFVVPTSWKKTLTGMPTKGKDFVEEFTTRRCTSHDWKLTIDSTEQDSFDAFGIAYHAVIKRINK